MSVLMSVVVHTLNGVSMLVLCICSLHTPTVSVKAGEIHAIHPGSCVVRPPGQEGLCEGEILVIRRPLLHGLHSPACPFLPVNLRCKSLCIVNTVNHQHLTT